MASDAAGAHSGVRARPGVSLPRRRPIVVRGPEPREASVERTAADSEQACRGGLVAAHLFQHAIDLPPLHVRKPIGAAAFGWIAGAWRRCGAVGAGRLECIVN